MEGDPVQDRECPVVTALSDEGRLGELCRQIYHRLDPLRVLTREQPPPDDDSVDELVERRFTSEGAAQVPHGPQQQEIGSEKEYVQRSHPSVRDFPEDARTHPRVPQAHHSQSQAPPQLEDGAGGPREGDDNETHAAGQEEDRVFQRLSIRRKRSPHAVQENHDKEEEVSREDAVDRESDGSGRDAGPRRGVELGSEPLHPRGGARPLDQALEPLLRNSLSSPRRLPRFPRRWPLSCPRHRHIGLPRTLQIGSHADSSARRGVPRERCGRRSPRLLWRAQGMWQTLRCSCPSSAARTSGLDKACQLVVSSVRNTSGSDPGKPLPARLHGGAPSAPPARLPAPRTRPSDPCA